MLSAMLVIVAVAFLMTMFEVDPRTGKEVVVKDRSKPPQTPPEISRKIAALEAEGRKLYAEYSKDGRIVTEEEFTKLEENSAEIVGLKRQLEVAERWGAVDDHLKDGKPDRRTDTPYGDDGNTRDGLHQYSILKAWRSRINPAEYPLDGIELETHQEMVKERAAQGLKSSRGIMIPLDLPIDLNASYAYARRMGMNRGVLHRMVATRQALAEGRALDTTAGAGSIPTILDTTMIDILRARMVTFKLGARVMNDMQGLFAIPRQASASTFYMVAQGSAVTPSNQTIDQVPFSPHTGGVNTQYTRQFLEQTNQDAEMFVREDQIAVVGRGVETAAINGQASQGYPMGIMQNPLIDLIAIGTNGGAPTWTQLVAMESHVAYFNADVGSMAYVCDALTRGTLKVTTKVASSTFPIYLWNTEAPDFPINGYPCEVTNLLPQNITKGTGTSLHAMLFGNWQDLIYAFWSGLDTIVDPYTSADQGAVRIITLQDFDVNIRHYQSFSNCQDLTMASGMSAPTT